MKKHLRGKTGFYLIGILIFAFLLSGCYTTEYYSYTPENLEAENAKILHDDEYTLVKIFTKTRGTIDLEGFFYKFTGSNLDSASKILYRRAAPVFDTLRNADNSIQKISGKIPTYDSVKVSDIKILSFEKRYMSSGRILTYIGIAAAACLVTIAILFISTWGPVDHK